MAVPRRWILAVLLAPAPAKAVASWTNSGDGLLTGLHRIIRDQPNEAQQALQSLDTNHDGHVGFDEVAAFAKAKGLDYATTLSEFAKFDLDRDGSLNAAELAGALGLQHPASTPPVQMFRTPAKAELAVEPATEPAGAPVASAVPSAARQSFAQRAATLTEVADGLDMEVKKEREAEELDRRAADLRAKAVALARSAAQEAREASARAARRRAEALFQNITELEDKAERAEVAAAVLRTKTGAERTELGDVTDIATSGLSAARSGKK
mmetsp:Transcript_1447/g.4266  ORF Transcript_1447/g.4266 Transcript_1447/m.4266 type:complete len:267 (+) Transcript_1447:68-868(+)